MKLANIFGALSLSVLCATSAHAAYYAAGGKQVSYSAVIPGQGPVSVSFDPAHPDLAASFYFDPTDFSTFQGVISERYFNLDVMTNNYPYVNS